MKALTHAALVAALLALAGCAAAYRSADNGFWRRATPHIATEIAHGR